MSVAVLRIEEASLVAEAAERMRRAKVGCLPVGRGPRLTGTLTEIGDLRHIARAETPLGPELGIVVSYP